MKKHTFRDRSRIVVTATGEPDISVCHAMGETWVGDPMPTNEYHATRSNGETATFTSYDSAKSFLTREETK